MNFSTLKIYTLSELKLCFRDKTSTFFSILLPAMMFIFFGYMYGQNEAGEHNAEFFRGFTPAMIATIIFISAMFPIALNFVQQKEGGMFKRMLATPLPASVIISSTLIKGVVLVGFGVIEMFILGYFLFDRQPPEFVGQFLIAFLLSASAFFAFAFLIAAFFNRMQSALTFNFIIFYPMMFLSGATFPIDQLPENLQFLSSFIPLTYVIQVLKSGSEGVLFTAQALDSVIAVTAIGLISGFIAARNFKWMEE